MANEIIITNRGDEMIIDRSFRTPTINTITQFKIGTNSATYSKASTDLTNPIPITDEQELDNCETADWTGSGNAENNAVNTNIGEFVRGNGCLNLGKTAGGTTATYEKTLGATFAGTSRRLSVFVFITDTSTLAVTDAVTIRVGSDSSNYYEQTFDSTAFNNNVFTPITLDLASPESTTGAPDINNLDYLYINFTTAAAGTIIDVGDWRMDAWTTAQETDFLKAVDGGTASVDLGTKTATALAIVDTIEANGYQIDSVGFYNAQEELLAIATFTQDSKSSTEIFRLQVDFRRPA